MHTKTLTWTWISVAVCLMLAGCRRGEHNALVQGAVTVDNQPIEEGTIMFTSVTGNSTTQGGVISKGRYHVNAPQGLMKVTIRATRIIGTKKLYNTSDSPEVAIKTEALPDRYNTQTQLQYEVKSGKNEKDWELQSK